MKILYILFILFVGCRENSFKNLKFNQKGKISPILSYSIEDESTLNDFIEELKLSKEYKKKLVHVLESKEEFKLNGKSILRKAAHEDDLNVMEAYYHYQRSIFDVESTKYKKLVFSLISIIIENKSFKCFEFLVNIIKNHSQTEYLNINEIFDIFLENNAKNTCRYINLQKEYLAIKETRKSTIAITINPKPAIDFNILTSIGLGIGYISMGLSKNCENMSVRTLLIIGGSALFATPIYRYWKDFSEHKKDIIIKQESIDNITAKLNSKKYNLLKIKDETEESELYMIDYLMANLNINLDKYMIEKFESVEKKKISKYLKNKLSNKKG